MPRIPYAHVTTCHCALIGTLLGVLEENYLQISALMRPFCGQRLLAVSLSAISISRLSPLYHNITTFCSCCWQMVKCRLTGICLLCYSIFGRAQHTICIIFLYVRVTLLVRLEAVLLHISMHHMHNIPLCKSYFVSEIGGGDVLQV